MNIQQHERIARIKKVSGYLYAFLTWIHYGLWVIWPLTILLCLIGNQASVTTGAIQINNVELTPLLRLMIITIASVMIWFSLNLVHHLRSLIKYFSEGDIFNKFALNHAQKALFNGLIFYGLFMAGGLIAWIYGKPHNWEPSLQLDVTFLFSLIIFGLMYVLVWTLEIGCDINEESELTI